MPEFLRTIAEYAGFESRRPDHAKPSKTDHPKLAPQSLSPGEISPSRREHTSAATGEGYGLGVIATVPVTEAEAEALWEETNKLEEALASVMACH